MWCCECFACGAMQGRTPSSPSPRMPVSAPLRARRQFAARTAGLRARIRSQLPLGASAVPTAQPFKVHATSCNIDIFYVLAESLPHQTTPSRARPQASPRRRATRPDLSIRVPAPSTQHSAPGHRPTVRRPRSARSSPNIIASIEAGVSVGSAAFEDSRPDRRRSAATAATRGPSFRVARARGRTRQRSCASGPGRSRARRRWVTSERRSVSRAASSPAKPPLTRSGATQRCPQGRWPSPLRAASAGNSATPPTVPPATFPAPAASGSGLFGGPRRRGGSPPAAGKPRQERVSRPSRHAERARAWRASRACGQRAEGGRARARDRRGSPQPAHARWPPRRRSIRRRGSGWVRHCRFRAAPRGRKARPGAGPHSLSSDGRPDARQGMQTPHRSAELSVDASSLAVSCGSRGVSLDIGTASLFGTRDSARCPLLRGQRQGSLPVRAKPRAVTWFPPNAGSTLRRRD